MRVKNVSGTSDNTCKCGSWLEHWRKYGGGAIPTYCSEKSCLGKDLVGSHVQKDGSSDSDWYIIPLCSRHNQKGGSFEVGTVTFVSAKVGTTCGK